MKKLRALLFASLILNFTLTAQLEFSKWFINNGTGLNFATSPPTPIAGFSLSVFEGVASIADSQGNLLFYSNGTAVNDASHNTMANGSGLIGNVSTTQAANIVKQPGNTNIYYLFTMDDATSSNQGAYYSIIDITLAAGMGSVTSKNNFLFGPNLEKQIAIRHCNGKDIWIICHEGNNNNFRAYLLTSTGLNPTPVISSIGISFGAIGYAAGGEMKASPDGAKIGWATYSSSSSQTTSPCGFYLYDFDASTGTVSNPLTLLNTSQAYGVEFSPDGTKLYGTRRDVTTASTSTLCQWNVCATNSTAIISSLYTTTVNARLSAIQKAIDNKLYLVNVGTFSMCVINNPNNSGSAMNLSVNSLTIMNNVCGQGLPNYITGHTKPQNAQISSSVNCQQGMFNVPSYTSATGCTNLPFPVNGYLWTFGDASSGAANSSTLSNPSHNFTTLGTYTVSLIVYTNCENDTIKKVISVTVPSPTVSVAGTFTICKGDKYTYTASGATNYTWSTGGSANSTTFAPITTTILSVTGNSAGCVTTKSYSITVNPCTSISSVADKKNFNIFPNPFNDVVSVEATEISELIITDLTGSVILRSNLSEGKNEVNTSGLKSGMYLIQASSGDTIWRGRFIKQ